MWQGLHSTLPISGPRVKPRIHLAARHKSTGLTKETGDPKQAMGLQNVHKRLHPLQMCPHNRRFELVLETKKNSLNLMRKFTTALLSLAI